MAVPETVLRPVLTTEEQAIVQQAEALVINDATSLAVGEGILTTIARLKKNVEDRRDWLVRPLNEHVKNINEWVRGMAAPLLQADALLRQKKLAYSNEVERQRREAERARLAAEAAKAKADAEALAKGQAPEPAAPVFIPVPPPPVTGIRRTWICEVEDPDLVPRQFCSPDAQLLQAAVNAGVREIAGVRIFQRESTVQR